MNKAGVFDKKDVKSFIRDIANAVGKAKEEAKGASIEMPTNGNLMNNNSVIVYELPIKFTGDVIGLGEEIAKQLYNIIGSAKVTEVKCVPTSNKKGSVLTLSIIGPDLVAQTKKTESTEENIVKVKSNEVGVCPLCNSDNLDYDVMEVVDTGVEYPWTCNDCGAEGTEFYNISFSEVRAIASGKDGEDTDIIGYEEGICPECGGNIDYGEASPEGGSLGYEYDCPNCGGSGTEWYDLKFVTQVLDGYPDATLVVESKQSLDEVEVLDISDRISKKQEDVTDEANEDNIEDTDTENEEEEDIDLNETISLLDMALREVPNTGVEDWGKDDELLFTADTVKLFSNLKTDELEIPKYYYDNSSDDDWSNGIDDYLFDMYGTTSDDGEGNNTYNWSAPLTHHVEYTTYNTDDAFLVKASIHRSGDVRGNYTTEFLLSFDSADDFYEDVLEIISTELYHIVEVNGKEYRVTPSMFSEYVDVYAEDTTQSWENVVVTNKEELAKLVSNSDNEEIEENKKIDLQEAYDKLSDEDIKTLKRFGHEDEDIPQIQEALLKTKFTYCEDDKEVREISAQEAVELLGKEQFLSGLGRSAYHYTAYRKINDNTGVSFDSFALFENKSTEAHNKIEEVSSDVYEKIKNEPRTEKYAQGLSLRDEIINAWKNNDLATAYTKWSELFDLFSTGYDNEGNRTADFNEEQATRDLIELTSITDTIEDKCVYAVTDYGKRKAYRAQGFDA